MSDNAYNFLHGYPTCATASEKTCQPCTQAWEVKKAALLMHGQKAMQPSAPPTVVPAGQRASPTDEPTGPWVKLVRDAWKAFCEQQCAGCKAERVRRKRVVDEHATSISKEFALAPLVTANNKPRYLASQQRAQLFARYHNTQVLWIQAEDYPIAGEVATYTESKIDQRRVTDFLKRHDQDTGGIMGLFPLVKDLPVRFTTTVDKKRKVVKFTAGTIVGWTLDPIDVACVDASTDAEIVLQKQPLMLFIKRAGEGMPQHEGLEPEVYGLKPKSADWPVGKTCKENWIKRFGFPIVPDFGATIHAVTGDQLPSLIGELDTFDATPTQDDAQKGYIVMSRVQRAENILIAQPFSPGLFRQGKLESTELLLKVLRGDVQPEGLKAEWAQIEINRKHRKPKLEDQEWKCGCWTETFHGMHMRWMPRTKCQHSSTSMC